MNREISNYQLPLPVLRGYLGPATITEFESPKEDGMFHRAWSCGCVARYRHSAHQTAVWRPCAAHRAERLEREPAPPEPTKEDTIDAVELRRRPAFCIVDAKMNVIATSSTAETAGLIERSRRHIARAIDSGETVVAPISDDSLLRVLPLCGQAGKTFAVIIERVRARQTLGTIVKRYGLTRREADVLRLIVANRSNVEIARELAIAESTVGDHVKSLFRKTESSRRTELVTKTFSR